MPTLTYQTVCQPSLIKQCANPHLSVSPIIQLTKSAQVRFHSRSVFQDIVCRVFHYKSLLAFMTLEITLEITFTKLL